MENQQTPQVLAQPFCAQGDKNTIPNNATGSNLASLQEGFPQITEQPVSQGGIPPDRKDFNGAMNLNSQFYFAFQNGWVPTFNQQVSDAIGGYPQNAVLYYFVPQSNTVQLLRSLIPNNTYNFVTNPEYIGQYWVKCLTDPAGLPMGAVYYSQSSLTGDNPGAVPAWQGLFVENGSQTYPDFFAWITSHTELCITKTEYDSDITTYGECPFYVLNETSAGNLRFPQLVNYIKNANSTDGITQSAAGLPNITGTILALSGQGGTSLTGAFYDTGERINSNAHSDQADPVAGFDASRSSSVYGNSTTVTPANTTLYPWIVVNPSATSISQCVLLSQVGTANGVASLDDNACVPFAQMPAQVVDNIYVPFDPSAYGWPDIRPAARPNAIAIMAGVKADYSAYDNLGFTATCEGGYNVYIDGVQYGSTFSSGAQCSITWSQYSATTGFSVSYPEELTAHIVQIAPAVSGNNITAFACARVASSGDEAQGMIWLHYNLSNEISLNNATRNYPNSRNTNLIAVTAKKGIIKATNTYGFISSLSPKLAFSPNLDLTSGIAYLADGNICGVGVKTLEIKNINSTAATFSSAFANCTALEKVKFTDTETGNISNFSQLFLNCTALKELPNINYTNAANMTSFITNAKSLKDFVLDLSYAGNLNTFGVYGNSSNRVDGLKWLLVSQNAPFTGSSPQINVSYTGLEQNALVALFNSLPTVTSGQIINITGATGASALTAQQLAIATNKGWTVTR